MPEYRVFWRLVLLVVFQLERGICDEPEYTVSFKEGFVCCQDYENKIMKSNMDLGKSSDGGGDSMFLAGHLEFCEDVGPGSMIEINIAKETELGSEKMWSCSMDLCKSLDDENAPWAAAMQKMNITGCPIKKGKYYCDEWMLDMDFIKDKLNHEWEGVYGANLEINDDKMNSFACYNLELSISPKDDRR